MKITITSDSGEVKYGEFTTTHPLRSNQKAVLEFQHPISETFNYRIEPIVNQPTPTKPVDAQKGEDMSDNTWQPPAHVKPWIVCAAINWKDYIITGARHFDPIMLQHIKTFEKTYIMGLSCRQWGQGFIDQWGQFYNRKEAMQAVKASGQPFDAERNGGNGEDLYSEGLY